MVKTDKEAARRIQSAVDKRGGDQGFKARVMAAADRNTREDKSK